jgi:uncharacterized phiE125 gp8 family phage protein
MTQDWVWWPSDPVWLDSGFWDWRPPWVRPLRPGTMRWALQQTQAPTQEPISLKEAKDHLRVIDMQDDDELIQNLIVQAREYVEVMTGRSLLTQTWKLWLDRFPRRNAYETWPWYAPAATILIPRYPVQSVTSIVWHGTDGSTNTVDPATYLVDLVSRFPRLVPTSTSSGWPQESGPPLVAQNAVEVTFVGGNTAPGLLSYRATGAMKMLLAHWYLNREAEITDTRVASVEVKLGVAELLKALAPPMVG